MKTSINRYLLAFAFGIGSFSWQSCKERTVTDTDMIPPVDNINTFQLSPDSLNMTLQTGVLDSIRTNVFDANVAPIVALGAIENDPFFGKLYTGLYLQIVPPVANFSFPSSTSATFDSAVLALPYAGQSFGDTTQTASNIQSFKVYRVTDPMSINDTVYTFKDYAFDPTPIGGGSVSILDLKDTFAVGSDTLSGQMRIKLDKNYIYTNIIQADTSYLSTNDNFIDYFKGWYIAPTNSVGNKARISYFTLAGNNTLQTARIDFYFHDAANKIMVYSFPFKPALNAYINRIKRNYQGFPAQDFNHVQSNRDSILIEGTPGYYSKITLRNLNKIPASVINQAELVITAVPVGMDQYFAAPQHLILEEIDASGNISPIADVYGSSGSPTTGGLNFMDGNPNTVTINGQAYVQYQLNFPRELQKTIMEGKDSLTLRIRASSGYIGAFRMVAPGFKSTSDAQMKLNIIYTKVK